MATNAKKTTAKKPVAKKAPAKRPVKKVAAAPVAEPMATKKMECGCTQGCACGDKCTCACKCGGGFWRFVKKLFIVVVIFALGFASAKFCCGNKMHRGPRVAFVNGCMDVTTVKCPEMLANLPMMDINGDECITREEYKAYKHAMRK